MILNKVTFAPFSPSFSKQQSPTPRLLTQNKKIHRKVNKMQSLQYTEKQPLNFDDTFCFTELHKNFPLTNKKSRQFKAKKYVSQILTIKHIYQNPSQRNDTQQNTPIDGSTFRGGEHVRPFDLNNEVRWQRDNEKSKFCQSSHSSRRKYSMNKLSQNYNKCTPQRPLTQQKNSRKQSTFIKNKFPFPFQHFTRTVKSSTFKEYDLKMGTVQMQKKDEMKQSVKPRKSNFFQYSIIRPDEIKPLALKKREKDRQNYVNRKKEYSTIDQQMLQQMRRKEEIIKRNTAVKKQQRIKEETQAVEQRTRIPTCYSKRKTLEVCHQQKSELKPWQVQGHSQLISNFDIL